jgi:hypothetical protein
MNIAGQMKQKAIHLFIMAANQLGAGLRPSSMRILRQALVIRLRHAFSARLEAIAAAFSWLDEPDHESVGAKRLPLGNIVTETGKYSGSKDLKAATYVRLSSLTILFETSGWKA